MTGGVLLGALVVFVWWRAWRARRRFHSSLLVSLGVVESHREARWRDPS